MREVGLYSLTSPNAWLEVFVNETVTLVHMLHKPHTWTVQSDFKVFYSYMKNEI